ncbi:MAG: PHP domain-containing protein [Succinimonas sp.]|nr:PHP domain-containing protein [Succinimonas sp.]
MESGENSSGLDDVHLWPMRYDLHSHSKASDGHYTPAELVALAKKKGVEVLALTDHDTSAGVAEAVATGKSIGMHVVAGIELSCLWHRNQIHIVGLSIDPASPELRDLEMSQAEKRDIRAREIGLRLEKHGFKDAYEKTKAMAAPGASITRGNYSRYLVSVGAGATEESCFSRYLGEGKPAYVEPNWPDMDTIVKTILAAGGIPVLAHPCRYGLKNKWILRLVKDFRSFGGEAIEVSGAVQGSSSEKFILTEIANKHELLCSCGSDFHHEKHNLDLGTDLSIPEAGKPVWKSPKFRLEC